MSTYASKRISRDPWPYVALHADGSEQLRRYRNAEAAERNAREWKHSPRPEFDNNPNPILVAFRDRRETQPSKSIAELASGELVWLRRDLPAAFDATREHIDHAKRVLERLVRMSA